MPRHDDEDDDRPRKRTRPRDDEDEAPRKRRRPRDDDEDDDRPRSRRRAEEDDDDDRPRKKKRKKKVLKPQANVLGIVALVIGGLAVLWSFVPCVGLYAFVPGAIGLVVGLIGLLMAIKSEGRLDRKMPIIGSSVSGVAILFGLSWIFIMKHWENKFEKIGKEMEAEVAKAEAERKRELEQATADVQAAAAGGATPVTAQQFYQAYEGNNRAANRQYKNRVLEVTGTVHEINFVGDTYTVLLRAGGPDDTVDCNFAKNQDVRAKLASLKPGDTVTIRGKCLGDGPTLEACVLVGTQAGRGE